MSAYFPGTMEPIRSAMPRTRAPPIVAISTTFSAGRTVGSPEKTLWSFAHIPISPKRSRLLLLAAAVGSQPHVDSPAEHRRNGGDAGAELHVALRIVGHLDAACREDVEFILFQPDAVGGDGSLVEKIKVVEMMDGLLAVSFPEKGDLFAGLGEVDLEGYPGVPGDGLDRPEGIGRAGVGRMADQGRGDKRRAVPPFPDEMFRLCPVTGAVGLVGRREIDEPLGDDAPHPAVDRRPATAPSKKYPSQKVVVPERIISAMASMDAGIDGLTVDETRLGGKDVVVEPAHQGKIIGQPPEEDHRKVGVGVHQSRHDE